MLTHIYRMDDVAPDDTWNIVCPHIIIIPTTMHDTSTTHCIPTTEIQRISHDLKNPLSTIKILTEVAKRKLPPDADPDLINALATIDTTCDSLTELIDTARAELTRYPPSANPSDNA